MRQLPIYDGYGRRHHNLRISVTDRCNIRCVYCMPSQVVEFLPRRELLSFEELARFVRLAADLGVDRVRITGGEPLVRSGLPRLVELIAATEGIADIALTTNGVLLKELAEPLLAAGLKRLNISLDAVSDETFFRVSRRRGIDRVLAGILHAATLPFRRIRLNTVIVPGLNDHELLDLARFARTHRLELRFIEFMPLNAEGVWSQQRVITGAEMRQRLSEAFGPLEPRLADDPSQPARDYEYADGGGVVGFIDPVSEPFCGQCNRLRISADGKLRNCLFSEETWDVRQLLRDPDASDADVQQLVRQAIAAKAAGHGMHAPEFVKPQHAMYQIGG